MIFNFFLGLKDFAKGKPLQLWHCAKSFGHFPWYEPRVGVVDGERAEVLEDGKVENEFTTLEMHSLEPGRPMLEKGLG